MATAQKYLANYFKREGFPIIDYKVYVFAGDGEIEEDGSAETCSLAGHLGLDNLVVVYDDNHISIDGPTELSFTEDRAKRFEAYGWYVQKVYGDGNDMQTFERALINAKSEIRRLSVDSARLREQSLSRRPTYLFEPRIFSVRRAPSLEQRRLFRLTFPVDLVQCGYLPEEFSELK